MLINKKCVGSKKGWLFVLPFRAVYVQLFKSRDARSIQIVSFLNPKIPEELWHPSSGTPNIYLSTALPLTGLCCKKTSCLIEKKNQGICISQFTFYILFLQYFEHKCLVSSRLDFKYNKNKFVDLRILFSFYKNLPGSELRKIMQI